MHSYAYSACTKTLVGSLTFTSMSPILLTARRIGRPTIDGNMCAGKLVPAYPHLTNWNDQNEWMNEKMCRRAANFDRTVSNALRCDPTQYGYVLASNAINFYFTACIFRIHFYTYTGAIITNDYIPSFAIHFDRIYSHWPISTHKLFTMGNSILFFCVRPLFPLAADFVWNRWLMSKTQRVSSHRKRMEQFPISRTQIHQMRNSNCQCCQNVTSANDIFRSANWFDNKNYEYS